MKDTKKEQLEEWEEIRAVLAQVKRGQYFEKGGMITCLNVAEFQ